MNVFKRIFKIGEAQAHSAVDSLEDPIKMTEQGIRDLKSDLNNSLKSLAEVKAMAIRSKNDMQNNKNKAEDYEQKAVLLLKKAQNGEIDASEADRLASEALSRKEESLESMRTSQSEYDRFQQSLSQLEANVKKLRSQISKYENELRTLKARVRVSDATKKLNKQMANIDSSSTMGMLERMKERVNQNEALAEAYGDIANESKSVDEEIDKALDTPGGAKTSADLSALKAKIGIDKE